MGALPDRLFIDEIRQFAADLAAEERTIGLYNAGDLDGLYDLATKNGMKKPANRKLFTACCWSAIGGWCSGLAMCWPNAMLS